MLISNGCVLDTLHLALRCGAHSILLTPIEYRLLAHLGAHLNAWVSEASIREAVWLDQIIGVNERSDKVEAAVARIRRKLKSGSFPLKLRTSRQTGLMLCSD